jgi:hypothetical protein
MLSSIKEPKNIPMSVSILHEREYNNLCVIHKLFNNSSKRRSFSDKNCDKKSNRDIFSSPKIGNSKILYEPSQFSLK